MKHENTEEKGKLISLSFTTDVGELLGCQWDKENYTYDDYYDKLQYFTYKYLQKLFTDSKEFINTESEIGGSVPTAEFCGKDSWESPFGNVELFFYADMDFGLYDVSVGSDNIHGILAYIFDDISSVIAEKTCLYKDSEKYYIIMLECEKPRYDEMNKRLNN